MIVWHRCFDLHLKVFCHMVFAVQVIGLKNKYTVSMSKGGIIVVFVELPGLYSVFTSFDH